MAADRLKHWMQHVSVWGNSIILLDQIQLKTVILGRILWFVKMCPAWCCRHVVCEIVYKVHLQLFSLHQEVNRFSVAGFKGESSEAAQTPGQIHEPLWIQFSQLYLNLDFLWPRTQTHLQLKPDKRVLILKGPDSNHNPTRFRFKSHLCIISGPTSVVMTMIYWCKT